jgi:hypothetical protein
MTRCLVCATVLFVVLGRGQEPIPRDIFVLNQKFTFDWSRMLSGGRWPRGLKLPQGELHLDVSQTGDKVAFCIKEVGGCISYKYECNRIGARMSSKIYQNVASEYATLIDFLGFGADEKSVPNGGISGIPAPRGVLWQATFFVGGRSEQEAFLKANRSTDKGPGDKATDCRWSRRST